MNRTKGCLPLLIGIIVIGLLFTAVKYYGSYFMDLYQRPWAYSRDANAPLLVGKWKGSFTDPDRVGKTLEVEVFVPLTDEERWEKAGRKSRRRRSSSNKRSFDGIALVNSRLGQEEYEIYGAVEEGDFHRLHFNFRPKDEKKRVLPNFTLSEAKNGVWQTNELQLTLSFSYHKADGSSFWSSADARFDKKAIATLARQK